MRQYEAWSALEAAQGPLYFREFRNRLLQEIQSLRASACSLGAEDVIALCDDASLGREW